MAKKRGFTFVRIVAAACLILYSAIFGFWLIIVSLDDIIINQYPFNIEIIFFTVHYLAITAIATSMIVSNNIITSIGAAVCCPFAVVRLITMIREYQHSIIRLSDPIASALCLAMWVALAFFGIPRIKKAAGIIAAILSVAWFAVTMIGTLESVDFSPLLPFYESSLKRLLLPIGIIFIAISAREKPVKRDNKL